MKKALIGLVILAAVAAAPYYFLDGENQDLSEASRRNRPGQAVALSAGITQILVEGPETGPVVVLIHGFSIPMFLWNDVARDLAGAGFRVIRYDLYGRGGSDRVAADHTPDLYDRQLLDLLDHLSYKRPVDLVGISMGGAVAARFVRNHPERVRRVVLISPYGFPQDQGMMAEITQKPMIGEYLMAVAGDRVFKNRLPQNFYQPRDYPRIETEFMDQLKIRGTKRNWLSCLRHFMSLDFTADFQNLGTRKTPLLLFWGRHDRIVPHEYGHKMKNAAPQAEWITLEDQGHVPPLERPETLIPKMKDFLTRP
jgi:pimeloyl-ACP methyl ester carboxylesterase